MDDWNDSEEVELIPFIHQVGGHSFMLSLDEATVCKALIDRELLFYKTLPPTLAKFTPSFYGVISVHTKIDQNGYVCFFARAPPDYCPRPSAKSKVRFKKNGSIEFLTNEGLFLDDPISTSSTSINPWVLTCHQQYMDSWKLRSSDENQSNELCNSQEEVRDFIVLENLVCRYSCPCVLDLKVGTRQYGDSVSLAKKQRKMVKVVSTTSAKLGLRVGGMQVFQMQTGRYLCRNKFYGRTLSVSGFQQALVQFLHNGVRFRCDVLSEMIRKLEELVKIISQLETIRLYTTSLLLLYEGLDTNNGDESETSLPSENKDAVGGGRRGSDGELNRRPSYSEHGAATKINEGNTPVIPTKRRTSSAANLEVTATSVPSSNSSSSSTIFEENVKSKARSNSFRGRSFSTKSDPGGGRYVARPKVDVRMVDFAHSTHKELDDVVVYSGPDRGFLFGLETLIEMLKNIETDYG